MSVFSEINAYINECDLINTTISNSAITTSSIDMNNLQITNVGDPINPQDAMTLNYLDTLIGTRIFNASNNQSVPANVTGLSFTNSIIRGFESNVSIDIKTTGNTNNLYAFYTLKGIQRDNDWLINSSFVGDITGIIFTITSLGQVQYTSIDVPNFISDTMKFKSSFMAL